MPRRVELYDTTLRDGAQGPRVKFSPDDQVRIVQELDALGIDYIEGGWPMSNPKAEELFARAAEMDLKHAKMAAFGSTRHPRSAPEDDRNLNALLAANTPIVTIFGKTSPLHAQEVLRVSLDQNLQLIEESVRYLKEQGRRVFYDAEHFFDGYNEDNAYAIETLRRALDAGAEVVVLCDTNGGLLPFQIAELMGVVQRELPEAPIGIHTHNDSGCGVANALAAVECGAMHVQGTINGYGERTGNANLVSIIPNLQLKMGCEALTEEQLSQLTHVSHLVAELANVAPGDSDPYVGRDAFTHKGGAHADAVGKVKSSYEHVEPERVGNRTTISVSEQAGRSGLLQKAREFGITLDRDNPETRAILDEVKKLENEGYEFEGADASLELLMRKATGAHRTFFKLHGFRVSVERHTVESPPLSEATVRIELPTGEGVHTAADGHGPVDALNNALRKALEPMYPELSSVRLEDYKVRILNAGQATSATTRVLIESTDGEASWDTVGVSEDIINASYSALLDSIEYKLLRTRGHADELPASGS